MLELLKSQVIDLSTLVNEDSVGWSEFFHHYS